MSRKKRQPKFVSSNTDAPNFDSNENRLDLGRALARTALPYMAKGLNSLTLIVDDTVTFNGKPTFAVDRYFRVYAHPEAIEEFVAMAKAVSPENPCAMCGATEHLELAYIAGVICHEMWHPLRKHGVRAKNITPLYFKIWNKAVDLEINPGLLSSLIESGRGNGKAACLPDWVLMLKGSAYKDQKTHYDFPEGKLGEEYYHMLVDGALKIDMPLDGEDGDPCGSGADGTSNGWEIGEPGPGKAPGLSDLETEILDRKIAEDIKDHASKHPGSVSGDMVRWANEKLAPPQYNWKQELGRVFRYAVNMVKGPVQTSYRRLSRLSTSLDFVTILPAIYKPQPTVSVVIDTSGSMNKGALKSAMSETEGLAKALGASISIIECDWDVGKVQIATGSARNIVLHGGGGTDMTKGIEAALKLKPKPSIIVIMTDGYTGWPATRDPHVNYIACLCGDSISKDSRPNWIKGVVITPEKEAA